MKDVIALFILVSIFVAFVIAPLLITLVLPIVQGIILVVLALFTDKLDETDRK